MNEEECNFITKDKKISKMGKVLSLEDINTFVKERFTEVKNQTK